MESLGVRWSMSGLDGYDIIDVYAEYNKLSEKDQTKHLLEEHSTSACFMIFKCKSLKLNPSAVFCVFG